MSDAGRGSLKPLELTTTLDRVCGFSNLPIFEDDGLPRSGLVSIEPTQAPDAFEITLGGPVFWIAKRPTLRPMTAIIKHSQGSLLLLVQKCRAAWEAALASVETTVDKPDGQHRCQPYEEAWDDPVDATAFKTVIGLLAVAGTRLFDGVFESNRGTKLDAVADLLRAAARSDEQILTIYAPNFHLPWRMLYTHPIPGEALEGDGANARPEGFWGYRHIIEHFTKATADGVIGDHVSAHGKLDFAAALHSNIDTDLKVRCVARHREFVNRHGQELNYVEWTRAANVISGLKMSPFPHQVVYFLCHAEVAGDAAKPNLCAAHLKFSDGSIDSIDLASTIGRGFSETQPIVFLNACRAAQMGTVVAQDFSIASEFIGKGALCLIGPEIEMPAVFAGEFGGRFFEDLLERHGPVPRAGVVLRSLTRVMWERHNPLALAFGLYAGADCHIRWEEGRRA